MFVKKNLLKKDLVKKMLVKKSFWSKTFLVKKKWGKQFPKSSVQNFFGLFVEENLGGKN